MSEDLPDGATPLDPDESEGLIPQHIYTREELNSWEQANILSAAEWVQGARKAALDEATIRELHRKMFDQTWNWAGRYRKSDKTIGVPWPSVPEEVRKLIDDGAYWIHEGTFEIGEAALRLHHRLVLIHPFPNGNGRHARLWCDLLMRQNGRRPFEWRAETLDHPGDARERYIGALRRADAGHYDELLELYLPSKTRD